MMWVLFDALVFVIGFAVCWQTKDEIKLWLLGPEKAAVDYRAEFNAILIAAKGKKS